MFDPIGLLPGQGAMTLFADFLLGVATARHHSIKSQTAGAEGAAAVLTAHLWGYFDIKYDVYYFLQKRLVQLLCHYN